MRWWLLGFVVIAGSTMGLAGQAGAALPGLVLAAGAMAAFTSRRRSA